MVTKRNPPGLSLSPRKLSLSQIPLISEACSEAWWQKHAVSPQKALGCTLPFIILVRLTRPKWFEQGISLLRSSFFVVPVFGDFKHRNRELLRVVHTHHLLQHINNLEERRLCSSFRVEAPTRLCQN